MYRPILLMFGLVVSPCALAEKPKQQRVELGRTGQGAEAGLRKAWRSLGKNPEVARTIESWKLLSVEACKKAGQVTACAEVCQGPAKTCTVVAVRPKDLKAPRQDAGYVCDKTRCVVASTQVGVAIRLLDSAASGAIPPVVKHAAAAQVIAVIPPFLWEWMTGSPFCCQDCWAKHRSWGLPCSADYACCAGTCGVEPGCGGGGAGGSGGGGAGAGGSGGGGGSESCGASRQVEGATVTMNGETCFFDGTVNPTMVNGECLDIAGEGVVYGCTGDVVIVYEEPKETQAPGP